MANEIKATVIGNLTRDLEARMTQSGKTMVTGSIAHTERIFDRQTREFKDGPTSFYELVIFGSEADNAMETLRKGSRAIVVGKQRVKNFDRKDGSKGKSVEIVAEEIGPSVKFRKYAEVGQGGYQNSGYQNQNQNGGGGYQQGGQQASQQQDPWGDSQPNAQQQAAQADPFANSAPPADDYGAEQAPQDSGFGGW